RPHDTTRPILTPQEVFIPPDELTQRLDAFRSIELSSVELDSLTQQLPHHNFRTQRPPSLRIDARAEHPAQNLVTFFAEFNGRVLLAAESAGRRELLLDVLRKAGLSAQLVT